MFWDCGVLLFRAFSGVGLAELGGFGFRVDRGLPFALSECICGEGEVVSGHR